MGKGYNPSGYLIVNLLSLGAIINGFVIADDGNILPNEDSNSLLSYMKELEESGGDYKKLLQFKSVLLTFTTGDDTYTGLCTTMVSLGDAEVRITLVDGKVGHTFIHRFNGNEIAYKRYDFQVEE